MPQSGPKATHHISASLRVESKLRVSQTRRANFDLVKRPYQYHRRHTRGTQRWKSLSMENHAFASLAHIRILLVPVGSIPRPVFEKYAAEIRSFEQIRLAELTTTNKDERARFMPNPLSTGHLHLSFPSHPPPQSQLPLSLFRISHFPLGVIGISSCSEADDIANLAQQFNTLVSDLFPSGGIHPMAKSCLIFESPGSAVPLTLGESSPGIVVIPNMMGNKKGYIGTLLENLCSQILGEFGVLVQTLESPLGNEYLNASLMPTLPPRSEFLPFIDGLKPDSRPSIPSYDSQPEVSKSGFTLGAAPLKRNSSAATTHTQASPSHRQSQFGPPAASKKRASGIGVASSHGRLFKVLGDLFLLAGRTEDATVWYSEAILLFKLPQDTAWHASALEGMATIPVLDAWAAGNGLNTSTTPTKEPWSDTTERLTQAAALYSKAPVSDASHDYGTLSYLYCCCILRHATLLFAIWSAKGWGVLAFTTLIQPGPTPYLPPTLSVGAQNSTVTLERLELLSGVSRSVISNTLAAVHGPWLLHLGARERISVLETTAGIYACLGYKRKEVYVLREVLGCILDLIVCGREEDGAFRSALPSIHSKDDGIGNVSMRISESVAGNAAILSLLKYVCSVLGINLDAVRFSESEEREEGEDSKVTSSQAYDEDIAEDLQEPFGLPELQVGVMREAIAVAEALPDHISVAQFAFSALKTLQAILSPGDQYHLYSTASRAITTAQRRGDPLTLEFWSGRPVISITISPLPLIRVPVEKPMSALSTRAQSANAIITGSKDPFLYNPRRGVEQGQTLVVQHEELEFVIILQNPYVFDLELQSVVLSTSGVPFETQPTRVVIPAAAFHQVVLTGKPLETGNLTVRGCIVQAPGGAPREFILPLATEAEEVRLSQKRSVIVCETERAKYSGLDARPWEKLRRRHQSKPQISETAFKFLECKVVQEQPLLRIRRTSVTHGAVMLYEGEKSSLRMTLENVSSLPVDFLRLAFEDSTMAAAQQALTEGEMSIFETYETEYELLHNPLFTWSGKSSINIPPNKKHILTVDCFGKGGCTYGTIHISYGCIHRSALDVPDPPKVFHTRQISYPIMVTVYQMLDCYNMDILPYHSSYRTPESSGNAGWCLFSVDVRNTYGVPFEVTFERSQEGTDPESTTTIISPGSTARIVLPLKTMFLSQEHISREIPTLSDRQFIVSKSKLSSEEESMNRALFWHREELFKCVQGRWREASGTRHGTLSLRKQRMSLHMLDTLRMQKATVQMSIIRRTKDGAEQEVRHQDNVFYPPIHEFVYLQGKVTSLSPTSEIFVLDFDMHPFQHIIHEGVLTSVPIGELKQGESREVLLPICFLCSGRFDIRTQVGMIDSGTSERGVSHGSLTAILGELDS